MEQKTGQSCKVMLLGLRDNWGWSKKISHNHTLYFLDTITSPYKKWSHLAPKWLQAANGGFCKFISFQTYLTHRQLALARARQLSNFFGVFFVICCCSCCSCYLSLLMSQLLLLLLSFLFLLSFLSCFAGARVHWPAEERGPSLLLQHFKSTHNKRHTKYQTHKLSKRCSQNKHKKIHKTWQLD